MKAVHLGQNVAIPTHYSPELLVAIERQPYRQYNRQDVMGFDRWNAFEFSWLNQQGVPQVSGVILDIPQHSAAIVESKSLKLYLHSFNNESYRDKQQLGELIGRDIAKCLGVPVIVSLPELSELNSISELPGQCLEVLEQANSHSFHSHLFRSLCPVTSQPDWASVIFQFDQTLNHNKIAEQLLDMVISFRQHRGFHESCVEMMFEQIDTLAVADNWSVQALFCRRGGIDINPFRSTTSKLTPYRGRVARQ